MGNERSRGVTNYIVDSKNNFKDYIYTTQLNDNIDILPSVTSPLTHRNYLCQKKWTRSLMK